MIRENFANNADSTLDGAIDNVQTTLDVADGTRFPLSGFRISIEDEILYCSSRSGDTLTVVRGAESTTAASHSDDTPVTHLLTAGAVEQLKVDCLAMMGLGRKPITGNTYGDEFDDDNFTGWTAVNSGGTPVPVVTEKDRFCSIYIPPGGATGQWSSWMKSCGTRTSGDWISMSYRIWFAAGSGFAQGTLWFADGATYGAGNQVGVAFSPHEDSWVMRSNTNYNNQTVFDGTGGAYDASNSIYDVTVRMMYNGSGSYTWGYSLDSINFLEQTRTAGNSFVPTYCGFGITSWGSSNPTIFSVRNFRSSF